LLSRPADRGRPERDSASGSEGVFSLGTCVPGIRMMSVVEAQQSPPSAKLRSALRGSATIMRLSVSFFVLTSRTEDELAVHHGGHAVVVG